VATNTSRLGRGGGSDGDTPRNEWALQATGLCPDRRVAPVDYTATVWWPCRDGKWRRVPARRVGDSEIRSECNLQRRYGNKGEKRKRRDDRWWCGESGRSSRDGRLPDTEPQQHRTGESGTCRWGESANECGAIPTPRHDRLEIESSLFPLAPGLPGRVGLLRGAGNAIHPQVAAEFIKAYISSLP